MVVVRQDVEHVLLLLLLLPQGCHQHKDRQWQQLQQQLSQQLMC